MFKFGIFYINSQSWVPVLCLRNHIIPPKSPTGTSIGSWPLPSKSYSILPSFVLPFDTVVCIRRGSSILGSWRTGINHLYFRLFGTIDNLFNFCFQYNQTAVCRMLVRVKKFKICWISRSARIGHPIHSVVLSQCEDRQDAQDIRCPIETGMDGLLNISVTTWPNFQNGVALFDSFFCFGVGGLRFICAVCCCLYQQYKAVRDTVRRDDDSI